MHSTPFQGDDVEFTAEQMGGDTLAGFRAFIRSLVMYGAVGTAPGGVCTVVGETQNLLIADEHFAALAVAINTGTNLPSVATPNGQAAFLFLLTSALAPAIRLGYMRMFYMALPYTVVMTIVGYIFQ